MEADIGKRLRLTVGYVDGESNNANDRKIAQSAATAPVVDVPSAPRNLEAAAGNARVDLRWDPPLTDNGSALTGYEYRQSADGGVTWAPDWGPTSSNASTATRLTVEGLTNDTEYTFEVRAVNGAGEGAAASDTATPRRPDTRGRVELSTNQPRVGQELTPTLIDPDNPVLAEAPWRWRRLRWPRSDDGDSLSASVPGSRSGESKLGVIARTRQYTPRVSDLHQWLWVEVTYTDDFGGQRVSATASRAVGPGPPCAPANLKAAPGDGQVTLTWEAGCNNGGTIDRYQYRRPGARKWVRVSGGGSARRQEVTGLTNGEEYTFEVRARNRQGWGPSAQATATPEAAGPPDPTVRTVSFEVATYQASEGGAAAAVTVRMSPAAAQEVTLPIVFDPPSGDYSHDLGTGNTLTFARDIFHSDDYGHGVRGCGLGRRKGDAELRGPAFGGRCGHAGKYGGDPDRRRLRERHGALVDDDAAGGHAADAVLTDPDGGIVVQTWQWQWRADGSAEWEPPLPSSRYPGLTSFTPQAEHVGKRLRVTAYYTDAHGSNNSAQSPATDPVTWPPLTVSFNSSTYQATEGGAAATVRVRMSPPAAQQEVTLPIVFDPPSGDYSHDLGTDNTLTFAQNVSTQSFSVTASEDADTDDERVTLSFGALPSGVVAGTPASTAVTLIDDDTPDPGDPPDPPDTPGTVRLSPTSPEVDQEVTATLVDVDGHLEVVAWQWQRRADASSGWVNIDRSARIPIAATSRYTPSSADRGQQLRATVSYTDGHGSGKSAQSAATSAVTKPDTPGTVRLSPTSPEVDQEVTATLVDVDGHLEVVAWQWQRRADASSGWVNIDRSARIPIAATSRYTPSSADRGQQLRATVGYTDGHGSGKSAQSAATSAVTKPDTPGTVRLSPTSPEVDQEVTATLVDVDGHLEVVAWQWQRRADASSGWVNIDRSARIPIAATSRYTPSAADRGQQLRATVGYTDGHGSGKSAQSAATSAVTKPDTPGTVRLSPTSPEVDQEVTATLVDVDGHLEVVAWQWQRRADASSGWVNIDRSARIPIAATSRYTPSAADRGQQLRATVSYTDGHGSGKSAQSAATSAVTDVPEPPDPPTGVSVSAPDNMGHERLSVSWTAPDNSGRPALSGYDVHYCKTNEVFLCDSYGTWSSQTVGGGGNSTLLTGLSSNTGYTVQVRARNADGTSAWSSRATGRTHSAAAKALAEQLAVTGLDGLAALAAPNPFNSSTTLYFQLTETQGVSLVIYSLAGQVVKTLLPGRTLKAGIHEVSWEGRDDQGRPVAAGVYFYRLIAGDKALVAR